MKKIIFIAAIICATSVSAQNIQTVLQQIEANNTTLAALKKQAEATKAGSRTGLTPANPEVEFNYLWGSPVTTGNRTDLNIMQSFDFPVVYYYKRKIADGKATQADLQYAIEHKALLLQARQTCIDLVYRNALKSKLNKRLLQAEKLALAYQTRFDKGEIGILELNKVNLNLLTVRKETTQNNIEQQALLSELTRLNGGNILTLDDSIFVSPLLPADFDQWYHQIESKNPALQLLAQEIEISRRQIQLSRWQWLPKLSVGYVSERIAGTTLQGVGTGISIPLWENSYAIASAKAQIRALQSVEADAKTQFYNTLKNQFVKVQNLQQLVTDLQYALQSVNNADLLLIALNKGHISLIEYLMEQAIYYDALLQILDIDRQLQQNMAILIQWE